MPNKRFQVRGVGKDKPSTEPQSTPIQDKPRDEPQRYRDQVERINRSRDDEIDKALRDYAPKGRNIN